MTKKLILILAVLLLSSSCKLTGKKDSSSTTANLPSTDTGGGSSTTNPTVVMKTYGYMFKTTATTDGGFAYTGSYPGSLSVADAMCATEATSRNLTGTYKAVVSLLGLRTKSQNWVLKASTPYRRPDGTVIGTTNSSKYFDFPLTHSIDSSSSYVWTGMDSSFTTSNTACSGWGDGTSGYGIVGDVGATTSDAISFGFGDSCTNSNSILCAEVISRTRTYTAQASYRRIFPSTVAMTAGTGLMGADGARRFDTQCQADADSKGISDDGKTLYKALVSANTTSNNVLRRLSCLTAYCGNGPSEAQNWVLEPNKQYRREDGTTIIGTTNANAIFDFPLTNSFSGVNEKYWTGFTDTWATQTDASADTCLFFQSQNNTISTYVGSGNTLDGTSINAGMEYCSNTKKVLCVEQARTQNVFVDYPGY